MSRGVGGMDIFGSYAERVEFLAILADVASKCGCRILACCLMGNHFHLLIQVGEVPLEVVMRRLLTRYSRRFNLRRGRKGHLFQARYRAEHVNTQAYYETVLGYIHNNPVKDGFVKDALDWPWSSHRQFVGPIRSTLIDVDAALDRLCLDRHAAMKRYWELMGREVSEDEIRFEERQFRPEEPPEAVTQTTLPELARAIKRETDVDLAGLSGGIRTRRVAAARREFSRRAVQAGFRISEVAKFLKVTPAVVSVAVTAALS